MSTVTLGGGSSLSGSRRRLLSLIATGLGAALAGCSANTTTPTDLRESPATRDGFYPGFPGFVSGEERSRMAYGDNLGRLADLKAEYDPENLLHSNLNVTPAR